MHQNPSAHAVLGFDVPLTIRIPLCLQRLDIARCRTLPSLARRLAQSRSARPSQSV
jgi:hypothetical protein